MFSIAGEDARLAYYLAPYIGGYMPPCAVHKKESGSCSGRMSAEAPVEEDTTEDDS